MKRLETWATDDPEYRQFRAEDETRIRHGLRRGIVVGLAIEAAAVVIVVLILRALQ